MARSSASLNASGGLLAVNSYDAYGAPSSTNNTYAGRFRYTGQTYLPELGIYYYKARMYAPTLGRFMQTDPIGYGDGLNWYAYVHGDPMNGTDPSGRANCIEHHAVSNVHFNGTTGLVTTTLIGHYDFDICGYLSQMQNQLSQQWEQARTDALNAVRYASGPALRSAATQILSPPCTELLEDFSKTGDLMQKSGLLFGAGGTIGSLIPGPQETGVPETVAGTGVAMYAVGRHEG